MILTLLCAKQREESGDILDPACEGRAKRTCGHWTWTLDGRHGTKVANRGLAMGGCKQVLSSVDYCVVTYSESGSQGSGATRLVSARQKASTEANVVGQAQQVPLLCKLSPGVGRQVTIDVTARTSTVYLYRRPEPRVSGAANNHQRSFVRERPGLAPCALGYAITGLLCM